MNAVKTKCHATWAFPLTAWHSYFQQNPTTYWVKQMIILNRQREMNGVNTKVLKPEPSHWVHDIPISDKTLQLTGWKSRKD
jgi:hypothetical protein